MAQGFGRDLYCLDEVRTSRYVDGNELLLQACYRRLTTPRGTLIDGDEGLTYGLDIQDFIGSVGEQVAADALPDAVIAEVLKDDRVDRCECSARSITGSDGLTTIYLDVDIVPVGQAESFPLTLAIGSVGVEILS